jgi:hypothetical protein
MAHHMTIAEPTPPRPDAPSLEASDEGTTEASSPTWAAQKKGGPKRKRREYAEFIASGNVPRRDVIMYLLCRPPTNLSIRRIMSLTWRDVAPDSYSGKVFEHIDEPGSEEVHPMNAELRRELGLYLHRPGLGLSHKYVPFLQYRPEIGEYLFQHQAQYRQREHMSYSRVAAIVKELDARRRQMLGNRATMAEEGCGTS